MIACAMNNEIAEKPLFVQTVAQVARRATNNQDATRSAGGEFCRIPGKLPHEYSNLELSTIECNIDVFVSGRGGLLVRIIPGRDQIFLQHFIYLHTREYFSQLLMDIGDNHAEKKSDHGNTVMKGGPLWAASAGRNRRG